MTNSRTRPAPRPGYKQVAETPVEALNQLNATLRKISFLMETLTEAVRDSKGDEVDSKGSNQSLDNDNFLDERG